MNISRVEASRGLVGIDEKRISVVLVGPNHV